MTIRPYVALMATAPARNGTRDGKAQSGTACGAAPAKNDTVKQGEETAPANSFSRRWAGQGPLVRSATLASGPALVGGDAAIFIGISFGETGFSCSTEFWL